MITWLEINTDKDMRPSVVHVTCQIIEALGLEGCSHSPAGPLDAQVRQGAFQQTAPHDHVLQLGDSHRVCDGPTGGNIKSQVKGRCWE